jgi:hypothetical protein
MYCWFFRGFRFVYLYLILEMTTQPKIHLLVFADDHLCKLGINNYTNMAHKLIYQAHSLEIFSKIHFYSADRLVSKYPEYNEKHIEFYKKKFSEKCYKGYGYYLWKPFLIWKTLMEIDEGDVLLYADVGCELHVGGKPRLLEYLQMQQADVHKNFFFDGLYELKDWTKKDTILFFGAEDLASSRALDVVPGLLLTTSNSHNRFFFKLWYDSCCEYHLVDDSPSVAPNETYFKDHRHDQSIFSILVRKLCSSATHSLFHEIQFDQFWNNPQYGKFPFSIQTNRG